MKAKVDVHCIGSEEMLGHVGNPLGPKDGQRLLTLQHPRGEDEVGVAGGVVGVQVGAEGAGQQVGAQGIDALMIGLGSLSHHPGAEIDQIGLAVHHHCAGRAAGIRAGIGGAGPEQNQLCCHVVSSFCLVDGQPLFQLEVRGDIGGLVADIDDHAGLGAARLFHIFDEGVVHRNLRGLCRLGVDCR